MPNAPYPIIPVPREKDWLDERPRSRILIGGLFVIASALVFIGGVLCLVEYSFHHHTITKQAIERAEADPRVLQAIGQPIEIGWFIKGNIHMKNANGYADLRIPISGPSGKATIVLYAREVFGEWQFTFLQVETNGNSLCINLLLPQSQGINPPN